MFRRHANSADAYTIQHWVQLLNFENHNQRFSRAAVSR